ncbi:Hypothetical protein SMAX5B_004208 [Scophthalmus maximus]|uniref:Uncharacterized protein n=1 Tax=Scophthalmus maximus TaxID=52904 RepID=A0A2U9B7X6_SCOMX|nr:Hypothetical protein SMAX5B_004208 [Scophthalmus maximus]
MDADVKTGGETQVSNLCGMIIETIDTPEANSAAQTCCKLHVQLDECQPFMISDDGINRKKRRMEAE